MNSNIVKSLQSRQVTVILTVVAVFAGIALGNRIGGAAHAEAPSFAPTEFAAFEDQDSVALFDARLAERLARGPEVTTAEIASSLSFAVPTAVPTAAVSTTSSADSDDESATAALSATSEIRLAGLTGPFVAPFGPVHDAAPFIEEASIDRPYPSSDDRVTSQDLHYSLDTIAMSEHSAEAALRSLTIVTRGEIGDGESLAASLGRQGVSPNAVHLIATEMRKVFDFRRSRPGDSYRLGQDSDGKVLDFRYAQNPEESYYLAWEGTRYTVRKETSALRPQLARIAGLVESSFYNAIVGLGEQSTLASNFADIFAWDIDFSRNVQPGDEFSILYERLYRQTADGDEEYVRPGRILAGRYQGGAGDYTVVYYEDEENGGAYFRPDGTSIERAFLAAPLEFSRISSRFTRARAHPILKVTRPHPGIDYAAAHGTPVYSVADGVIEYKARAGASGNLVRIRHKGGYTSHYAHLSRFAKLKVGDSVKQKQVIGYVGSSGLSTGPHVCFRVKKDGDYVDPMKISSPAGEPVDGEEFEEFSNVRDQLLASLGQGNVSLADEAL